jgi:3-deoxy-D-manno-octulosonic-acid transferase
MPRAIGWIYQALVALGLVLAGPVLLLLRGRHYWPTLSGRWGRAATGEPPPHPGALWLHSVSVGETAVAANLATRLVASLEPSLPILITTVTPTGQARARAAAKALGARARTAYLPFDLGGPIDRFLRRHEPAALVLVEGDYWPLLLSRLAHRRTPVAVVNGRLSDRSFPRLLRFRPWVRRALLDPVSRFAVQSAIDRERLVALGVAPERIAVTGNLKFDFPEPPDLPELAALLARLAAGRPIVVAGSTMPGEEESVLVAFAAAGGGERSLLVLAPRHPERFMAVAELARARFPGSLRRSRAAEAAGDGGAPPVVVLDTIGELAATYRAAAAAFIGGTLVPRGGHNPLEAARFGVPIAVGPSMENFREIAELYDREPAWARVADSSALGATLAGWLADPAGARALGERGRAILEANRGATGRTIAWIEPLLATAGLTPGTAGRA